LEFDWDLARYRSLKSMGNSCVSSSLDRQGELNVIDNFQRKVDQGMMLQTDSLELTKQLNKLQDSTPSTTEEPEMGSPLSQEEMEVSNVRTESTRTAVSFPSEISSSASQVRRQCVSEVSVASSERSQAVNFRRARFSADAEIRTFQSEASSPVDDFLKLHGFDHVGARRFWCLGHCFCYPLHEAVRKNDPKIVQRLLKAGADHTRLDWKGRTALGLAMQLDKNGSHNEVLSLLKIKPIALAAAKTMPGHTGKRPGQRSTSVMPGSDFVSPVPQLWDAFFERLSNDTLARNRFEQLSKDSASTTPTASSDNSKKKRK
jgi:hypothetical protein